MTEDRDLEGGYRGKLRVQTIFCQFRVRERVPGELGADVTSVWNGRRRLKNLAGEIFFLTVAH